MRIGTIISMCVRPSETTLATQVAKIQVMRVIVLIVIAITISSCGFKPSVSCSVDDINTVIDDCKKQPKIGITKQF